MNCIIIDDEPLAREAMEMLVEENKEPVSYTHLTLPTT